MFSGQQLSPSESSGEISKGSSMRKRQQEASGYQDSSHVIPSTPDKYCTVRLACKHVLWLPFNCVGGSILLLTNLLCVSASRRSGGFFSKILKKRKEAQTPDGELTFAQALNEKPTTLEGKLYQKHKHSLAFSTDAVLLCEKTAVL